MSLENAVKENDTYALQANYHPQHIHIRNEINHAFIHSQATSSDGFSSWTRTFVFFLLCFSLLVDLVANGVAGRTTVLCLIEKTFHEQFTMLLANLLVDWESILSKMLLKLGHLDLDVLLEGGTAHGWDHHGVKHLCAGSSVHDETICCASGTVGGQAWLNLGMKAGSRGNCLEFNT